MFSPLPCILSQAFCLSHTHSRTRSHGHTLFLIHSLTNAQTHHIFIPILLAHSHTFLSFPLSFLFLSFSLSLSLSLSYTHTLIHTHIRTHTLSHLFTRSSTHSLSQCRVCALRCLQRAYALALSSLCFSPPPTFYTPGSHDFNLKQSCSHCKCILLLSCPWRFLSDGTVEEKNRGRGKLMRKDRDLLVPATKFPYSLSYATDGRRLLPKSRML